MSWDAALYIKGAVDDDVAVNVCDINYTHNCNRMIADAVSFAQNIKVEEGGGPLGPAIGPAWWEIIHDKTGQESELFFRLVLEKLVAEPEYFKKMNPKNGWGDYHSLVEAFKAMHRASLNFPQAVWTTSG